MKVLNRSEMKKLTGGGSCQALVNPDPHTWTVVTHLSAAEAEHSVSRPGEHWCCDQCCSASWSDKTGCP